MRGLDENWSLEEREATNGNNGRAGQSVVWV
jgi:hypothetical protein